MQKMQFQLNISPEQYRLYYQGSAKFIHVRSEDGRHLQFPASEMQRFVEHSGIQGRFEIVFNDQHKLVSLSRIKEGSTL